MTLLRCAAPVTSPAFGVRGWSRAGEEGAPGPAAPWPGLESITSILTQRFGASDAMEKTWRRMGEVLR